jgi:hypothetical protein
MYSKKIFIHYNLVLGKLVPANYILYANLHESNTELKNVVQKLLYHKSWHIINHWYHKVHDIYLMKYTDEYFAFMYCALALR